jgi:tRNA G10  N-methylase Trm11
MSDAVEQAFAFDRTWFAIEQSTPPEKNRTFEIPEELAKLVIEKFSAPEDVVLDPYAGSGAIVLAAQQLGRIAIGIEQDLERVRSLAARLEAPSRILQGEFRTGKDSDLPRADLIFTSPPNTVFGGWDDEMGYVTYWPEFDRLFERLASLLKPGGTLVFEAANLREGSSIRPLAFEVALHLSQTYLFVAEYVRCNVGPVLAAPHSNHSHLFVFKNTRTTKRRIEDVVADKYL